MKTSNFGIFILTFVVPLLAMCFYDDLASNYDQGGELVFYVFVFFCSLIYAVQLTQIYVNAKRIDEIDARIKKLDALLSIEKNK